MRENYLSVIKNDIRNNKAYYIITYSTIMIGAILMILYAKERSVWMDDMAQMHMIMVDGSIMDWLNSIIQWDNNPPLSHLITMLWMKIVPYGNMWLKLPNILFVVIGSGLIAETARRMSGNIAGTVAGIMAITASGVVEYGAYTVRPYGLLFCTVSFVIFAYYQVREKSNLMHMIMYTVSLVFAVYTHFFAVFIVGIYGLYDFILLIKKKIKIKDIMPYVMALLLFLPYFLYSASTYYEKLQTFWASVPGIESIQNYISALLGVIEWWFPFLLFSIILVLIRKKRNEVDYIRICVFQIVGVVGFIFIYSRFINPEGSVFVPRYFIAIVPACILVIAEVVELLLHKFTNDDGKWHATLCAFMIFLSTWCVYKNYYAIYLNQSKPYEPWEEMADYIMAQPDIYDNTVAVYNTSWNFQKGWDYYLTHNGQRTGKDAFWYDEINSSDKLNNIDRLYVARLHCGINSTTAGILESDFVLVYEDAESGVQVYDRKE